MYTNQSDSTPFVLLYVVDLFERPCFSGSLPCVPLASPDTRKSDTNNRGRHAVSLWQCLRELHAILAIGLFSAGLLRVGALLAVEFCSSSSVPLCVYLFRGGRDSFGKPDDLFQSRMLVARVTNRGMLPGVDDFHHYERSAREKHAQTNEFGGGCVVA